MNGQRGLTEARPDARAQSAGSRAPLEVSQRDHRVFAAQRAELRFDLQVEDVRRKGRIRPGEQARVVGVAIRVDEYVEVEHPFARAPAKAGAVEENGRDRAPVASQDLIRQLHGGGWRGLEELGSDEFLQIGGRGAHRVLRRGRSGCAGRRRCGRFRRFAAGWFPHRR